MNDEPWYCAKCLFQLHELSRQSGKPVYEERMVLLRAADFDEAIRKAEAEARDYAAGEDVEYLGYVHVYHIYDAEPGDGTEVFSLMRTTDLPPEAYIEHYHDDGMENGSNPFIEESEG